MTFKLLPRSMKEQFKTILADIDPRLPSYFPLAVSAILAHEAGREGSGLYNALRGSVEASAPKEAKEDKKQRRKKE